MNLLINEWAVGRMKELKTKEIMTKCMNERVNELANEGLTELLDEYYCNEWTCR